MGTRFWVVAVWGGAPVFDKAVVGMLVVMRRIVLVQI